MQIRARNAGHLRTLKKKIPALVNIKIQTDASGTADYFARLIVPVLKWQIVMGYLADEATRYTNYKDALRVESGQDVSLMEWAHGVWHMGTQYQKQVAGGGTDEEDEAVATALKHGPHRVIVSADGDAVPPEKRPYAMGIDFILVRRDGWSIGGPRRLYQAARGLWDGEWLAVVSIISPSVQMTVWFP